MHRSKVIALAAIATSLAAACGGGQAEGETTTTSVGSGSDSEAGGEGAAASSEGGGDEGAGGQNGTEFQLRDSDTAGQARGEYSSAIEATPTEAAMRLFVVDRDRGPVQGIVIKMTAPDGTQYYTAETDAQGYAEVLVPIGQRYEMEYLSLGRRNVMTSVEVPSRPNNDIRLTLRYRRERYPEGGPPRFVLEGVHFDTDRATIRSESFPRLDRVVEYMTHRPNVRIRIAGHTDNVGNSRANQRLSERRAQAVRDYLVSKGIDRGRIEAVGFGDQQPVASNDTEEGRQQNRRIEAVEL